jgi:hypothetical protein
MPPGKSLCAKAPTSFPVSNTAFNLSPGGVKTLGLYFLRQIAFSQ